jgi:hypothetical protein
MCMRCCSSIRGWTFKFCVFIAIVLAIVVVIVFVIFVVVMVIHYCCWRLLSIFLFFLFDFFEDIYDIYKIHTVYVYGEEKTKQTVIYFSFLYIEYPYNSCTHTVVYCVCLFYSPRLDIFAFQYSARIPTYVSI